MITEITKSVIATLIVAGAIISAIFYPVAGSILNPLAGVVIGYYFKSKEQAIIARAKKFIGRKSDESV